MNSYNIVLKCSFVLFIMLCYFDNIPSESIYYLDTERPTVLYTSKIFVSNYTLLARRISRKDPRHYVSMYIETIIPTTNDVKIDLYFYQFLTNRYRPSFVELHFGACDFLNNDPIIGTQLKRQENLLNLSCPYPPGKYYLRDMTIPFVPKNFPFQRGRIYCNVTRVVNNSTTLFGQGYIDMEIKQMKIKTSHN